MCVCKIKNDFFFANIQQVKRKKQTVQVHACETPDCLRGFHVARLIFTTCLQSMQLNFASAHVSKLSPVVCGCLAAILLLQITYYGRGAPIIYYPQSDSSFWKAEARIAITFTQCYVPFFSLSINNSFECPLAAWGNKFFFCCICQF